MKVQLFGQISTYDDISMGGLFWYNRATDTQLGLKVHDEQGEGYVSLDRRDANDTLRFRYKNVIEKLALFELADSIVRPSRDPADWGLKDTRVFDRGDLVFSKGAIFLSTVKADDESAHVDIATGKVGEIEKISAIVKRWSIVQLIDGLPVTLFKHEPARRPG